MERFLILGCHRTGTTLLRLVLDSHPKVHCFDEALGYEAYEGKSSPSISQDKSVIGYKLPSWTELFLEYDGIHDLYKNEPIVFMVRDVRDTVTSMKLFKTEPESDRRFLDGVWTSLMDWKRDPNRKIFQDMRGDLNIIENSKYKKVAAAAFFWKYKTTTLYEFIDGGYPVLPVRYDIFVANPKEQIARVVKFLGLEWSDSLLRHFEHTHGETANGVAAGLTEVNRAIDTRSVGRWKDNLSVGEYEVIMEIAGDLNNSISSPLFA